MIHKKTKIVCTIGPATWDEEKIRTLIDNGMDMARLNFSHGDFDEKRRSYETIRRVSNQIGRQIAILADLSGPKIRLGEFDGRRTLSSGEKIVLSIDLEEGVIPIAFDLSLYVNSGNKMYLNDGLVGLTVDNVEGKKIFCTVLNDGWISSKKGINAPGIMLGDAAFTKKDYEDARFALELGCDYIGLSFVQTVDHVQKAKELIREMGKNTKVIVKIEKPEALEILPEIIDAADAVMVARGDLAVETSPAQVPLIQHRIIRLGRQKQKPVIVATQMLLSMVENPRPTRAEASDVANAVLEQVDAVMLSDESATGKYPIESVQTLVSIIDAVENSTEFRHYIRLEWGNFSPDDVSGNAIVASGASLAFRMQAHAIGIGTVSGKSANQLSSFRPNTDIIAFVHDETILRQLSLLWGVHGVQISHEFEPHTFGEEMTRMMENLNLAKKGHTIVLIWGGDIGTSGKTDRIQVATV